MLCLEENPLNYWPLREAIKRGGYGPCTPDGIAPSNTSQGGRPGRLAPKTGAQSMAAGTAGLPVVGGLGEAQGLSQTRNTLFIAPRPAISTRAPTNGRSFCNTLPPTYSSRADHHLDHVHAAVMFCRPNCRVELKFVTSNHGITTIEDQRITDGD